MIFTEKTKTYNNLPLNIHKKFYKLELEKKNDYLIINKQILFKYIYLKLNIY